jgi:hypothetical protein
LHRFRRALRDELLDWRDDSGVLTDLHQPLDDELAVELERRADIVAIDAPFGWPMSFVRAVGSQLVWVTTDGQTWKLAKSPSSMLGAGVITNDQRGLVVLGPSDNDGPPTIATVGDSLTVTTLRQAVNGPIASATSTGWMPAAFGRTGVVILSSDGLNLWLGVPTAS